MSTQDRIYDFLRKALFLEVVVLVLIISGCYPPAASMQDARVVGKGGARLAGYWYGLEDAGAGGEKVADVYGGLIGIGSSDRTEIQFRLDHFEFPEEDSDDDPGYEFVSIGPKFGFAEDRLAVLLPFGVYVNNGISFETFQIHPTFLATLPAHKNLEVNASAKITIPFDPDYFTWLSTGVGVGLSTNLDRWVLLPEVSYSICLDESEVDPVWTYGIGLVVLARP